MAVGVLTMLAGIAVGGGSASAAPGGSHAARAVTGSVRCAC